MAKKPTLISYFGGKSKFESFISPCIPKDIKRYVEPFSGSFAIYFLTDINSDVEIVFNDLNKDQANLVACCKEHQKFYDYVKNELDNTNGILYCKEKDIELRKAFYKDLYYSLKKSSFKDQDFNIPDMKRATYYSFLLTSAFSSISYTAAGFSGFNKNNMKLLTFIKKLQKKELQKKLEKISVIETLGFEELIKKYDSEDTFMYLDPPYNSDKDKRSGWYGTKDEFGQEQHKKLLNLLTNLKCRWALSYYYFDELEKILPKDKYTLKEKDFFRSSSSFSETKSVKGTELLIMNFNPENTNNKSIYELSGLKEIMEKEPEIKPIVKSSEDDDFWK